MKMKTKEKKEKKKEKKSAQNFICKRHVDGISGRGISERVVVSLWSTCRAFFGKNKHLRKRAD